tara:strand:+ start:985 stop:2139 length:1155 start_codon:yes stop_codon:yes gene_type:complete
MKKIYFKLIKDISSFFLLVIISVTLIVWVIQAVNYLDFVSEDGHNFVTYFKFTILSYPKIFNKIFMFVFFISLFYIIVNYEEKNQLVIYWSNGISKIKLVQTIIFISFFFLLLNLIFSLLITPKSLDKARSYLRESDINFLSSIKENNFTDVVKSLTIYVEKKNDDGSLTNILLKEGYGVEDGLNSKLIFAKKGISKKNNDKYIISLFDGSFLINENNKITNFSFEKIDFDLSKYQTKTVTYTKIQELSSLYLFTCIKNLTKKNFSFNTDQRNKEFRDTPDRCKDEFFLDATFELSKRIVKNFYIPLMAIITSMLVLFSKHEKNYNIKKIIIFILAFLSIVVFETTSSIEPKNINYIFFYFSLPLILFFLTYFFINIKLHINKT